MADAPTESDSAVPEETIYHSGYEAGFKEGVREVQDQANEYVAELDRNLAKFVSNLSKQNDALRRTVDEMNQILIYLMAEYTASASIKASMDDIRIAAESFELRARPIPDEDGNLGGIEFSLRDRPEPEDEPQPEPNSPIVEDEET